jgi:HemY protein
VRQQLWGKARSYFEAGLSIEESYGGHMELAHLLDQIGDPETARTHYRRSLELAARELRGRASAVSVPEVVSIQALPETVRQISEVAGVNESQKN